MTNNDAARPAPKNPARISGRRPGQGWKWIAVSTRFAIYHRDGFACVYCGTEGDALGYGLSLDHLTACELGGTDTSDNLVTCCGSCNSAKGDLTMRAWYAALRTDGANVRRISRRIRRLVRVNVDAGPHRIAGRVSAKCRIAHAAHLHAARTAARVATVATVTDLAA